MIDEKPASTETPAASLTPTDKAGQGAGAGGGNTNWRDTLNVPEEVKSWEGLNNIKDPSDAVTQLYNAQKLLGKPKLPAPDDKWTDKEWDELYGKLGRPEKPEDYKLPEFDEEQKKFVHEDTVKAHLPILHAAGLSNRQIEKVLKGTVELAQKQGQELQARMAKAQEKAQTELLQEWGDDYTPNIELARHALSKLATPQAIERLQKTGLHADPDMIRLFYKVGQMLSDSKAEGFGQGAGGLDHKGAAWAKQRLNQLQQDKEWMEAFTNRRHPRHEAVNEEYFNLHIQAAGELG